MCRNLLACRLNCYEPFAQRACEHLAGLGVRHVETYVPRDASEAAARRAELERFGLRVSSMQGRLDLTRADIAEQLAPQLRYLADFGCQRMLLSVRRDELPLQTAAQRLRDAGQVANDSGVTLMIETHPDLATNAEVARQTIDMVDHAAVRINFDPANIYFYNHDANCVRDLEVIAPFVAGVHLKDTNGGYRTWHFPTLGTGVVDFPALLAILVRHNYNGPLTLEIEGIEGETRAETLVLGRIEQSVAYMRTLGDFG